MYNMRIVTIINKEQAIQMGLANDNKISKPPKIVSKLLSAEGKNGSNIADKVYEHIIDPKTNKVYEKRIK